jgi:hypothetical protein
LLTIEPKTTPHNLFSQKLNKLRKIKTTRVLNISSQNMKMESE